MARDPVCIGCGQETGPRPRLNRLPDGKTCPTCQDRLLESLPPVLPAPAVELDLEEWTENDDGPDDFLTGA